MSILLLIALNVPVYLFVGWVVFDTAESAAETFFEMIVEILKNIFIPSIIRVFMEEDDVDVMGGLFSILGFFVVCGLITYGEYCLISKYFGPL